MLFDRVVREQSIALALRKQNREQSIGKTASNDDEEEPLTMGLEGVGRCAYLVFQDLCVLSRGEQGVWLKRTCVAPSMGLELVESVLSQQPQLFSTDPMFSTLVSRQVCAFYVLLLLFFKSRGNTNHMKLALRSSLKKNQLIIKYISLCMSCVKFCVQVCPLLLQILHERIEFPLFVRIMRAFTTLLRDFGHVLIKQCEPLLGALLHCLASSAASNLELAHSGFEDGVGASAGERVRPILISLSLPSFFFFSFFFFV
jgi:hypothetical protein